MENEKRLIDANALMNAFRSHMVKSYDRNKCTLEENCKTCEPGCLWRKIVSKAPTVDAVEVVHGHWKEYLHSALVRWKDGEPVWADRSVFRCSRCDFGTIARHNYCPRCGAKMDGGNEDAER